jgi:acyl-CoA synthetase (AMP-forming)/AMP-acid ligase II
VTAVAILLGLPSDNRRPSGANCLNSEQDLSFMNGTDYNVAQYLLGGKEDSRRALLTLKGDHSYGELRLVSADVAKYLTATGGHKGDRVILVSDNSLFWVAAYLGILRSGLVCVPLPPNISQSDFDYIVGITEARFAFLQSGFAAKHTHRFPDEGLVTDNGSPGKAGTPSLDLAQLGVQTSDSESDLPLVSPSDLAALMFTSGSTGKPRGVMVSHRNIQANTDSIIQYLQLTGEDRIMTVLPFHYCFGTSLLHTHLRTGGTLVLDHRFMYPEKVLQRMQETECTGFAGVPSHYQILLRKTSLRKKSFPHLRYVQQAGGHLAPVFLRELHEALPTTQIFVMYGQTEATARLSYLPPDLLETKLGSVGKGIPGVHLSVLNEAGVEVRPGEVGEIVAQGENVTRGYWRAPEETAASFRKGKLYTGDLATLDEEGFIFIAGRAKDFLKCGGKRISCKQLEQQLLECEDLLEAAVIGVPDEVMGEAVKVFVVSRSGSATVEERLRNFCKQRLPFELVPREIVVLNTLPKSQGGKVLKEELRDAEAVGVSIER